MTSDCITFSGLSQSHCSLPAPLCIRVYMMNIEQRSIGNKSWIKLGSSYFEFLFLTDNLKTILNTMLDVRLCTKFSNCTEISFMSTLIKFRLLRSLLSKSTDGRNCGYGDGVVAGGHFWHQSADFQTIR